MSENIERFVLDMSDCVNGGDDCKAVMRHSIAGAFVYQSELDRAYARALRAAISEVERLYDEWWDVERRTWLNVVLERLNTLKALSPATPVSAAKDLRIYDRDNQVVTQGALNALMARLDSLEEDLECVTAERDNRQRELDGIYARALIAAPTPTPIYDEIIAAVEGERDYFQSRGEWEGRDKGYEAALNAALAAIKRVIAKPSLPAPVLLQQLLVHLEKIDTTKIASTGLYDEATAVAQARIALDQILEAGARAPGSPDAITVEEARRELRVMFPGARAWQITCYADDQNGDQWRIGGNCIPLIAGTTLAECMSQARAWKQQQSEGSVETIKSKS